MQLLRLVVAGLALLAPTLLHAQAPAWPTKSIRWIIPYPPGGITDNATRMVVQKIAEQTGWTIVVENKPGANSILGADIAAKAAPDGYTFLTVIAAHAANATLYAGKLPFDVVKSFAPVSLVGIAPLIMTANNDLPVKDIKELIAYAKANPRKLSFGSSGVGAAAHLTTELFNQTAGVEHGPRSVQGHRAGAAGPDGREHPDPGRRAQHADAAGARRQDQGARHVLRQARCRRRGGPHHCRSGRSADRRLDWVLFLAPAGTPQEIVNRFASETATAVASADIKSRFETIGIEPVGNTPDEAGKFLDEEIAKWAKVISTAGVKPEQ
jgi:tripartite-type tricarboxylate transporter receptor subunit TctC